MWFIVETFKSCSIESIQIPIIRNWLKIAGFFFLFSFALIQKNRSDASPKNQGTRRPCFTFTPFLILNWKTKNRSGAPVPLVGQLLFLIQFKIKNT
jgi:hypothetical protein